MIIVFEQTVAKGPCDQLCGTVYAELAHNICAVSVDCISADIQTLRDSYIISPRATAKRICRSRLVSPASFCDSSTSERTVSAILRSPLQIGDRCINWGFDVIIVGIFIWSQQL